MGYYDSIVENKWLAILSEPAKNILYFSISNNYKRIVTVNNKKLQKITGLNFNAIQDGIEELTAFQFFSSNNKTIKKAKLFLKKNNKDLKELVFILNPKVPKINDTYYKLLNHGIYKKTLISLVSKRAVENQEIKEIKAKKENLKDKKLSLYYKQLEFLLRAKKEKNKAFKDIYKIIDYLENEKKEIEKELKVNKKDKIDYSKLNYHEKSVIKSFEQWTNNDFPPEDIDMLQDALKIAYPNMIKSGIKRTVTNTKTDITSFEYFYVLIQKGVFGKKPQNKKSKKKKTKKGENNNGKGDFWEDFKNAK